MAALRTGERDGLTAAGDAGEPEGHSMNGLRSLARWHPSLFGGVIGLCLLANVIVPGLFWDPAIRFSGCMALFVGGCVVAQIGSVALWCGASVGSFRWRVLGTGLLTMLITGTYVAGLRLREPGSLPYSEALFLVVVGATEALIIAATWVLLGQFIGVRLANLNQPLAAPPGDQKKLSLAHLIGCTSVVAVVIATWQSVMPPVNTGQVPSIQVLLTTIKIVSIQLILSVAIIGCCAWLILRIDGKWIGVLGLGACFIVGLPLDLMLLQAIAENRSRLDDDFASLLSFTLGLTCATLGFLWLLRLGNLRLGSSAATHEA